MILVRAALISDLKAIADIYNEAVLHSVATFDTEIKSYENRLEWFSQRNHNFPVLVAETDDGKIAGYAALNKWSEREAYAITAEASTYIATNYRGIGIGKMLLSAVVQKAQNASNLHSLIARITVGNESSLKMATDQGFVTMGVMKEAGIKFGQLHDVVFLQKMLRN